MKCYSKTMLFSGAGLLAAAAIAYAALPQFRSLVLGSVPSLLFLLCPLSMIFMTKGMNSHQAPSETVATDTVKIRGPAGEPTKLHRIFTKSV
jgi:hypothetical protein